MFRNWFEYCGCCISMPTIGFIFIWSFSCISEWIQRKAATCCEYNLGICLYQMLQWTAPSLTNTHTHTRITCNLTHVFKCSIPVVTFQWNCIATEKKNFINCGTQRTTRMLGWLTFPIRTNPHQFFISKNELQLNERKAHRCIVIINSLKFIHLDLFAFPF